MQPSISGDRWPDDVRLSDLEPRFVCSACGKRGADVRLDFSWEQEVRRACRTECALCSLNISIGRTPPIPSRIAGEHSWRTHHRRCRYRFLCWFDPLDNQRSCGPFLPRTSVEISRGKFYSPVQSVRPTFHARAAPPEQETSTQATS